MMFLDPSFISGQNELQFRPLAGLAGLGWAGWAGLAGHWMVT